MRANTHPTIRLSFANGRSEARAASAGFLGRVLRTLARRRVERKAIANLASMNDHLLRDIGITRGDVDRVVRQGRR